MIEIFVCNDVNSVLFVLSVVNISSELIKLNKIDAADVDVVMVCVFE